MHCDDPTQQVLGATDCDLNSPTSVIAATRETLEEASVWLEKLEFSEPALLRRASGQYLAMVSDTIDAPGVYNGVRLFVRSETHFAAGADDKELAADLPHTGTIVHELFHAIQHQYNPDLYGSYEHDWIWEGTAEAVMHAWLERSRSGRMDFPAHRRGGSRC